MNNKKIIDKIAKCFRLSESCNSNEAAAALRQAYGLMKKYGVTEDQIWAADVSEVSMELASRYTPPFWVLALSNVVAQAFDCRAFVARRFGRQSEFRFIGVGCAPEISSYTFSVLHRRLRQARSNFIRVLDTDQKSEKTRRGNVFAQAWLFRVAQTVSEFAGSETTKKSIETYIREQYGEIADIVRDPAQTECSDYDDILSGMRAANDVKLHRSVRSRREPLSLTKRVS